MPPLGWLCSKVASRLLRVPRNVPMPINFVFCLAGSFAINNSSFDLIILLAFGVAAWLLEESRGSLRPPTPAEMSAG